MTYLAFGTDWLLAAVFAWSAATKLSGRGAFTAFRRATARLVPALRHHATALAVVVVGGELTAAVSLVIPAAAPMGLVLALALLTAFTVAVAVAIRHGDTASCNCFGRSAQPLGPHHLVRNAFLLAVTAGGLVAEGSRSTGADLPGLVLAGAAAAALATLVINADSLAALFSTRPVTPRENLERTMT